MAWARTAGGSGVDACASGRLRSVELMIARNPDPDSSLPYLLWVPIDGGLVFRTKGTWPRTSALYCHPVDRAEWPTQPEIVERVQLRACTRRGAAVDVICDRAREQRSQIVFTRARGRDMVFWQSPRTRKQSRPEVQLPKARAQGVADLEILVDAHERYPFTFAAQQVRVVRRALTCGDYAIAHAGLLVAAVERKSLSDLVSSLGSGRLRYQLSELAALPRAAVVVEDRYSQIFALRHQRPSMVADGLAELQIRWPTVPIVYCDNRSPRNGPTATSPPLTPGPNRNPPYVTASASTTHKPLGQLNRRPPHQNCERGRKRAACPSLTADDSNPRSSRPGTTRTPSTSHNTSAGPPDPRLLLLTRQHPKRKSRSGGRCGDEGGATSRRRLLLLADPGDTRSRRKRLERPDNPSVRAQRAAVMRLAGAARARQSTVRVASCATGPSRAQADPTETRAIGTLWVSRR